MILLKIVVRKTKKRTKRLVHLWFFSHDSSRKTHFTSLQECENISSTAKRWFSIRTIFEFVDFFRKNKDFKIRDKYTCRWEFICIAINQIKLHRVRTFCENLLIRKQCNCFKFFKRLFEDKYVLLEEQLSHVCHKRIVILKKWLNIKKIL
jgi:hypothetical protein